MRKYGFYQFYCGHLSKKEIAGNTDLVYFSILGGWPDHDIAAGILVAFSMEHIPEDESHGNMKFGNQFH